ncbi:MAG: hypothetical protein ACM3O8_00190 [Methylococcaceae bacterium]|nr:hypothetical protein [Prolixibacteraceae bacterium]
MKNVLLFLLLLIGTSVAYAQPTEQALKTLTQEQYRQYFPIETQIAMFVPTTDFVCILPTHEKDTALQKEVNEYYNEKIIKKLPTVPNQIARIITDKEALKEDLSNLNIHAFGTVEGNLWISQFMKNAKDFPVKITSDSIVAEETYVGNDYMVTALWVNPSNYKHSLTLYIPQNLQCAKSAYRDNSNQYTIWQKGKKVKDACFHLRNGKWIFSDQRDSMLEFRNVNHLMEENNVGKIDRFHYRYPTENQLSTCPIDEQDILVDTIKLAQINDQFSNVPSLDWLKPIAEKNKIVAIGESHHLRFNQYLMKDILFSLNKFDHFSLLVLELNYSYAGYFNYYLSLDNDNEAKVFSDSVLTKIFPQYVSLMAEIRNWNKLYPEKKIQVGCSDLEHDFMKTIQLILNPYLLKTDPKADVSYSVKDTLKGYLARAKEIIEQAKKENVIGDYSFQTPQYMESVYENLASSIPIKIDPKNFNDHSQRFLVMIRNVTDKRFLGKQVADEKSVFYGGSEHFRIVDAEDYFSVNFGMNDNRKNTEGYFLAHSFEPTKGNVYTIRLNTLAVSIEDSIQRINPNLRFTTETDLIKLYKAGKIKLNEPVLGPYPSEFDKYIYKLSYKYPNYAFRIKNIDLDAALKNYEGFTRFTLFINLNSYTDYNTNIVIPYSPVGDN